MFRLQLRRNRVVYLISCCNGSPLSTQCSESPRQHAKRRGAAMYATCLVHNVALCRTSNRRPRVRAITVPRQEFCGVAFLLRGQTGGWPRRPCLPIPQAGAGFLRQACACRTYRLGRRRACGCGLAWAAAIRPPNQYRGFKSTRESCRVQCCARSARHPVFPAPGPPPDFLSARTWLSAAAEVHSGRPWLRSGPGPACASASRRTAAHCAGSLKA